jgi:two-component system, NarL family, sensor kinase
MDSLSKEVTIIILASVFFIVVAIGIIILILVYQKKQLQYIGDKKQLQVNFEKEILASKLEIQEQTLKNISQEIHDNIGQVLSLVKLNINTMNCNEPVQIQNKINDSRQLITKAIQDLRDISRSLNTDHIVELGLSKALDYELEMIKKTGGYQVEFEIEGKQYRLESQKELILFRIVQEVLHNIIKHARATMIKVKISFEPGLFTLKIIDNGVGFDASRVESNDYSKMGLGVRNMHNRAKMINTHFQITSILEKGTTIVLTLPLEHPKTQL